jgi:polysaccharide transporter, PST family
MMPATSIERERRHRGPGTAGAARFLGNALSLYVVHFGGLLLGIATVPYLVRVLGPAGYGEMAFAFSLVALLLACVDGGLTLSATRSVSLVRDDAVQLSRLAADVWAAKAVLCLLAFAGLLCATAVVPRLQGVATLLFLFFGIVLGSVLNPAWLFQGVERMGTLGWLGMANAAGVFTGMWLVVEDASHAWRYAALFGGASVVTGCAAIGVAFLTLPIRPRMPTVAGVRTVIRSGFCMLLSSASIAVFTVANPFILGLLASAPVVGLYAAAERLVLAIASVVDPVLKAAYPRAVLLASRAGGALHDESRWLAYFSVLIGAAISLSIFLAAPFLVSLALGEQFLASVGIVRLLGLLPLLTAVNAFLTVQLMLPLRQDRAFLWIVAAGGAVNVAAAASLVPAFGAVGMAAATVLSQGAVCWRLLRHLFFTGRLGRSLVSDAGLPQIHSTHA